MTPAQQAALRSTTRVRPAVRSSEAMRKLEASLRRLGVDESTVAVVTGRARRSPYPHSLGFSLAQVPYCP